MKKLPKSFLFLSLCVGAISLTPDQASANALFVSQDPEVLCTTLEVESGDVLFEGDMIVARCEQRADGSWIYEPRGVVGEAIAGIVPRAAFRERATWPGGVVPYEIDASLAGATEVLQDIDLAIRHWKDVAGYLIIPRDGESNYVTFQAGSGCTSYVGQSGGGQPINLVSNGDCGFGATVHEIGHAIGFWHEQSRLDRDNYVTINFDNVSTTACNGDCSHNFQTYSPSFGQDAGGYDYGSIMHYSATAFTTGGDTISPLEPAFGNWKAANGNIRIGFRGGLSSGDAEAARIFREECVSGAATGFAHWVVGDWSPCATGCPAGVRTREVSCLDAVGNCVADTNCTDPKPDTTTDCSTLPVTCDFETDTCAWDSRESGEGFDWINGQGTAESRTYYSGYSFFHSGPTEDHTLGTGDGTYYHLETLRRFKVGQDPAVDEVAYLTSPPLDIPSGAKLSFWYHAYGGHCRNAASIVCSSDADCAGYTGPPVCELVKGAKLESIPCDTGTPTLLWDSQEVVPVSQDAWRQATVNLPVANGVRLRLTGRPAQSYDDFRCTTANNACLDDSQCFTSGDTCDLIGTKSSPADVFAIDDIVLAPENLDECAAETDNCSINATCTDSDPGFTCACNAGYSGDGVSCTEFDECSQGTDNCSANATCTNTVGSFTCACNAGYSGDGVNCTDFNECSLETDNCSANATCTNQVGWFTCACNAGYSGDGVNCTDFDECSQGTDNCSANATCTNVFGSFTCACNAGFEGDGRSCAATPPTCSDGIQNQDETGVDCGGSICDACSETCSDGIQNQDETGVDCGGSICDACAPVCGNSTVEEGETCDDGGTEDRDGCSSRCQIEATQDKDQRKCLALQLTNVAKVAKTQGKENQRCVKDAGKGKLEALTPTECLVADRKERISKLATKLAELQTDADKGKCLVAPNFGYQPAVELVNAVTPQDVEFFERSFASSPDLSSTIVDATDRALRDEATCQATVLKVSDKVVDTYLKNFVTCAKKGLGAKQESERIISAVTMESCWGSRPDKVEAALEKHAQLNVKKCSEKSVDWSTVVAGECANSADEATFADCVSEIAACQSCQILNAGMGLAIDCDQADDDVSNGSCPALPWVMAPSLS